MVHANTVPDVMDVIDSTHIFDENFNQPSILIISLALFELCQARDQYVIHDIIFLVVDGKLAIDPEQILIPWM